jgi:multidrug efflux system outer membrane protein
MKTPFNLLVLAAAAVVVLAGCTTTAMKVRDVQPQPDLAQLPALAPAASATLQPGLAIQRWWLAFDDPALQRLVDEALAHNADLEQAQARVREAQAALDAARAVQWPSLDLQWNSTRGQASAATTAIPPGTGRIGSQHEAALVTQYELDLWGKLASGTAAARHQLLATEWARGTVQWRLSAQVAEAYFSLLAVQRQADISEAVRQGREATVKLRERERSAGIGNEFNVRRAEAELNAARATLAALGLQRASLEHSLALLTGRAPQRMVADPLPAGGLLESRPFTARLPQGAAADLLARRPDVRQAEAQLAAANASLAAVRAQAWPSVRLSGAVGSDARSISDLFSGPAFVWSLGASATQALLDGGRTEARARQEQARAQQALAVYRQAVAAAFADLRQAYQTLDLTQQAWQAQREQVAALERSRELARVGFERGAFPYLDLLDAERSWYQAQLQHVAAYRDQLIGQVAAFKALGGGYDAQTQSPLQTSHTQTNHAEHLQ